MQPLRDRLMPTSLRGPYGLGDDALGSYEGFWIPGVRTLDADPISYGFDSAPFAQPVLTPTSTVVSLTDATTGTISPSSAGGEGGASLVAANGRYDIVVNYTGDSTYRAAFTQAAARWSQIITADIPDLNSSPWGFIDDLLIEARIVHIDGPGGILGQAGPDWIRNGSLLPAHGVMEFDEDDVASMFANGTWTNVILHEMGHILGIGTLWDDDYLDLRNNAGNYIGTYGLAEYRTLSGNFAATSVPLEHGGGSGTAGAHWDEAIFNTELMTGYAEAGGVPMPISRLTIGALQDIGYTVNYSAADFYTLPGGPQTNVITGDGGNNTLVGTSSPDTINGLGGNDTISGNGGNDTIDGGTGNDGINGGAGDDTAVFAGNLASYTLQDRGVGGVTVVGPDGSDTLSAVEHLRFANGTVHFNDGNGLFDTIYYDRSNLDVFAAGIDAQAHYNAAGWREGRDPNAYFDSSWYLATNADVRASGANPLLHYQAAGWREGRDPGPNFDTKLYLINNPDVAGAGFDPLWHYLQFGIAEGRTTYAARGTTSGGFDAVYYLANNPDVAAAGIDPLSHFNGNGWREGRNPNALFDTKGYLAHYADVRNAGLNPLTHYEGSGWLEGRDPSTAFDTRGYLAANPDVAAAHANPLDHYLNAGIYEGRTPVNDGLWFA
jgi:Ca2+-binding RTX toxin-like protein